MGGCRCSDRFAYAGRGAGVRRPSLKGPTRTPLPPQLAGAPQLASGGVSWTVNERQAEALVRAHEALMRVGGGLAGLCAPAAPTPGGGAGAARDAACHGPAPPSTPYAPPTTALPSTLPTPFPPPSFHPAQTSPLLKPPKPPKPTPPHPLNTAHLRTPPPQHPRCPRPSPRACPTTSGPSTSAARRWRWGRSAATTSARRSWTACSRGGLFFGGGGCVLFVLLFARWAFGGGGAARGPRSFRCVRGCVLACLRQAAVLFLFAR